MNQELDNEIQMKLLNIAKNIRKLRNDKKYSQMRASHEAGISYRIYQNIESNKPRNIHFATLYKLLKFYNVKLERLMNFNE